MTSPMTVSPGAPSALRPVDADPQAVHAGTEPIVVRAGSGLPGVSIGAASAPAAGKKNEDFHGVARQGPGELAARGLAIALADGVSGSGSGRVAAEAAVRAVLDDYYAMPHDWDAARALDRALCAINEWLFAANARSPEGDGAVCALSVLVFAGSGYRLAHVGDTRVYRLRETQLRLLTTDHVWPRCDMRHVLRRAVGLDTHLVVDYTRGELAAGDTFVMLSDGVWEVLGDVSLRELLERNTDPQRAADALIAAALQRQAQYMGRNDATAVVARIVELA